MRRTLSLILTLAAVSCGDDDSSPNGPSNTNTGRTVSFFVTSVTSPTGNLGGLTGADARCQSLAAAAGRTTADSSSRAWSRRVSRDARNERKAARASAAARTNTPAARILAVVPARTLRW